MKNRFKNSLKLLALSSIFILFFQNCSLDKSSKDNRKISAQNNGGSYGGKISSTFYRFSLDRSCEIEGASARILLQSEKASLSEYDSQCFESKKELSLSDIDRSIFQTDIIGFRSGIFEGFESTPESIPANLVEIWCRDQADHGIETIVHYDRLTQSAVTRLYYQEKDSLGSLVTRVVPDFSVARVLTSKIALIRDNSGFELSVYRDQTSNVSGLFKGLLKTRIKSQEVVQDTLCRLGGSLDPNLWPAKQVSRTGEFAKNLGLSPDGKFLAYIGAPPGENPSIFVALTDGSEATRLNGPEEIPSILGGGVAQAAFSSNSQYLFYASKSLQTQQKLWRVNLLGELKAESFLNSTGVNSFSFQKDQNNLIFDYTLNIPYKFAGRLQSVNLNTGVTSQLTPNTEGIDVKGVISGFDSSNIQNKVVYLWDSRESSRGELVDLYSVNIDGSNLLKITPQLPSIDWHLKSLENGSSIPEQGNFVIVRAYNGLEMRHYAVAIDGSGSRALPLGWTWSFGSPNGVIGFINPFYTENSTTQAKLMNFKTGQLIALPPMETFNTLAEVYTGQGLSNTGFNLSINTRSFPAIDKRAFNHPSLFFTSDSKFLIGRSRAESGNYQVFRISTEDGDVKNLCPEIQSPQLWVQNLNAGRFLITTYDYQSQFIHIYLYKSQLGCQKINSLLSTNSKLETVREVTLSPDGQKILMRLVKKNDYMDLSTQIYYVPLNGKPAYQINYALSETAEASQAFFTGDSRKVIYIANQFHGGEAAIYLWKVPVN
jgi:hypothetical protein